MFYRKCFHKIVLGFLAVIISVQGLAKELSDLPMLSLQTLPKNSPIVASSNNPTTVDIMILYTSEASEFVGGYGAMLLKSESVINQLNEIFVNSQVYAQANLVYSGEIQTDFLNNSAGKPSLQSALKMFENNKHINSLRKKHGADLVQLFAIREEFAVDDSLPCGLATLTTKKQFSSAANMVNNFQITAVTCGDYYSVYHFGRNMGLGTSNFSYAKPYRLEQPPRDVDSGFRTVMAHPEADCLRKTCSNESCTGFTEIITPSCPTIPYFSNPNLSKNDGKYSFSLGVTNENDNVRVLNITAPIVAQFQATKTPVVNMADAAFLPYIKPSGIPVYRFWSDVFNHQFITISEAEKSSVIANDTNWTYDGIAFYAHETQVTGTVPLYRFWSDAFAGHFYTSSESEKALVEKNSDWRYEGVAFYVYPEKITNEQVPIYRLWSDQNHFRGHFYTSFEKESQVLENSENYVYEGVSFYANGAPNMCKKVGLHVFPFETGKVVPSANYETEILKYNKSLNKKQSIVMFFADWKDDQGHLNTFGASSAVSDGNYTLIYLADQIHNIGATPMLTWQPWAGRKKGKNQPDFLLDYIISGVYDDYINKFANDVKRWGHPILLRPMQDMNTDSYPWSCSLNGDSPNKYVQAFRHIKNLFMQGEATNAKFVWSPNYTGTTSERCQDLAQLYPGDDYVDYIGVSAYNRGKDVSGNTDSVPLQTLLEPFLDKMAQQNPTKEVIVTELGVSSDIPIDERTAWLTNAYNYLATKGTVAAIVYFDDYAYHDINAIDFRVTTGHSWSQFPVDPEITQSYKKNISVYCE